MLYSSMYDAVFCVMLYIKKNMPKYKAGLSQEEGMLLKNLV